MNKGGAAQEGFLLILDADLGETAGEGEKILAPVVAGEADLCIGRLPAPRKKAGCGFVRTLATAGITLLTGLKVTAPPLSGQRALSPRAVAALDNRFAPGFGVETGMIIDLARKKMVIKEVPVEMAHPGDRLGSQELPAPGKTVPGCPAGSCRAPGLTGVAAGGACTYCRLSFCPCTPATLILPAHQGRHGPAELPRGTGPRSPRPGFPPGFPVVYGIMALCRMEEAAGKPVGGSTGLGLPHLFPLFFSSPPWVFWVYVTIC